MPGAQTLRDSQQQAWRDGCTTDVMADFDVFENLVSQYMTTEVETARLESDLQIGS